MSTFEDGLAPTSELHVATDGSDESGDGSAGNPYATIEHALALATPGTAVQVHAGTYGGGMWVSGVAGTEAAPIWVGGVAGEARPVIEGGAQAIQFSRVRWLVIHDLEVRGASANGINCDDGGEYSNEEATAHLIFRDLFIHDIGSGGNEDCLKLSGVNDYVVMRSELASCGGGMSGSGIDHVGCHHGVIALNEFHDNSGNAVQCKGGSEDIEIRWNHFVDPGERGVNMGGSTGFDYFRPPLAAGAPNAEARDIRVVSNVFEGGTAALAFVGCVGCVAVNNTIIDPGRWVFRILQETTSGDGFEFEPCRDGLVANNLVVYQRGVISTHVNVGANTEPATFTFTNNLWYASDDPGSSTPDLPVTETGSVIGADPGFTTGFDIGPGSPAAGAGAPWEGLVGDIDGVCYGSPPSIGAYEP